MSSTPSYIRYMNALTMNGAQVLHMCIAAIAVPAIIGVEQYGKYASLFAIPGAVGGFIETIFILSAGLKKLKDRDRKTISAIIFMVSCITISVTYVVFGFDHACISSAIIVILSFRSFWMSRVLAKHGQNLVRSLLVSDALTAFGYVFAISLSVSIGIIDFRMPIIMVLMGGGLSGISYMLSFRHLDARKSDQLELTQLRYGHVIGRSYEELFYTIFPLILNHLQSSRDAGLYRITISIFKGVSKIFPYRYDTFSMQSISGPFLARVYIRDSVILALLWLLFCLGLLMGGTARDSLHSYTNMLMMAVAAGPSVCLGVALPTFGLRHPSLHIMTLIGFFVMLLFAATPYFAFVFAILHFGAWGILMMYIRQTHANNTNELINA